jgi:hypothetical protein
MGGRSPAARRATVRVMVVAAIASMMVVAAIATTPVGFHTTV